MSGLEDIIENNVLYLRYRKWFDLNVKYIELTNSLVDKLNAKKLKDTDFSDFQRIVALIACKAMRLFAGIHILANKGHSIEGALLLRSLLEGLIDLKYINKDREHRSLLFINYLWKELKNALDIAKKYHPEVIPSSMLRNENLIVTEYEKIKSTIRGRYWCGKNIEERAREVGFKKHYDTIYRLLCRLHHPSFVGMLVNVSEGEEVVFDVAPNDEMLPIVLKACYGYYSDILNHFRLAFDLNGENQLRQLLLKSEELKI